MRKIIISALFAFAAVACGKRDTAVVDLDVHGADSKEIVVSKLAVNEMKIVDTIKTNASGKGSFEVKPEDGSPNFYYVSYNRRKLASLILKPGDKVKISVDTLGQNLSVSGSDESVLLKGIEDELVKAISRFDSLSTALVSAMETGREVEANALRLELGKLYVKKKQASIRSIMTNPHSFTNITVLYQQFTENLPIFADSKDALFFKRVYDSLQPVYPNSMYVRALKSEVDKMENLMAFSERLSAAGETDFPSITLPDVNSNKISLSSLVGHPFVLVFCSMQDVNQKLYNQDLLEIYNKYKSQGLEIYQVCVDTDKTAWATAVKDQKLPWITVCDGLGAASPAISSYNVSKVPALFVFDRDGKITAKDVFAQSKLDAEIARIVK